MTDRKTPRFAVLAAIDSHDGSPLVLSTALALAGVREGGEVHLLTVADLDVGIPALELMTPPTPSSPDVKPLVAFAESQLRERRERHPGSALPRVEVHAAVGYAPDEIVWLAAHVDADLVVVGTHGRRGARRMLMGSVSERVARLAGCPVMVVREKSHAAPWRLPEVEPVCPECAQSRATSRGTRLWCARHEQRHARAHVYSTAGVNAPLRATESSTGT